MATPHGNKREKKGGNFLASELMRFFENIKFTDKVINATGYSDEYGFGRFGSLNLYVDATVAQETKSVAFEETQAGNDGVQATWTLSLGSADGGTFDIGITGDMQTAIAWDAVDGTIQTALRAITGTGWDEVTYATGTITLPLSLEDVTLVADFDSLTEGAGALVTPATLATGDAYIAPVDTIHTFQVMYATGGTFTITYDSDTSSALAWNISAADLKAAIVALKVGFTTENVTVVLAGGVYTVTFTDLATGDNVTTNVTSLTQTSVTLQIELEMACPITKNWFTMKQVDDSHYFASITETGTAFAGLSLRNDGFRIKYTVGGIGPIITLVVAGTAKG